MSSSPAHPKANNIIVATIKDVEYKAFVTHFDLVWTDPMLREDESLAWTLRFSYFISKKREKGLIAGWETNPHDPFQIEILPITINKYQKQPTYKGLAKFNTVVENTDLLPMRADFVLDIIGAKVV